jgi:hypothetical protein
MIEIAYGLQAVGSLIGGISERKAAKRRAAFQRRQITMQRDYALEDLRLSSMGLQSQIMASAGASGVRTSSGNVRATQADELLKESRRAARIMAGSEMELEAIASNLKTEKRAATTGTLMDLASIGVSYYGQNTSP